MLIKFLLVSIFVLIPTYTCGWGWTSNFNNSLSWGTYEILDRQKT